MRLCFVVQVMGVNKPAISGNLHLVFLSPPAWLLQARHFPVIHVEITTLWDMCNRQSLCIKYRVLRKLLATQGPTRDDLRFLTTERLVHVDDGLPPLHLPHQAGVLCILYPSILLSSRGKFLGKSNSPNDCCAWQDQTPSLKEPVIDGQRPTCVQKPPSPRRDSTYRRDLPNSLVTAFRTCVLYADCSRVFITPRKDNDINPLGHYCLREPHLVNIGAT